MIACELARRQRIVIAWVGMLSALTAMDCALGEETKPKAAPSALDEQLLDNLSSELLEGLETTAAEDAATGETSGDASEQPADNISESDEDAFTRISKRMREAEKLISQSEALKTTRKVQREIVTDLDKLIADLEEQCQKSQSSSSSRQSQQTAQRENVKQPGKSSKEGGQNSNNPARDSTQRLGKDEVRKADMEQMKGLLKDLWGQLPDKAREQMLQFSPEQFLPKYELLIEQYYKRLAEEQTHR